MPSSGSRPRINIFFVGHDIEQMMNPITEIDIGGTRLSEHDLRPPRPPAAIGMRSSIHDAIIRFRLDDPAGSPLAIELRDDNLAQQFTRDLRHVFPPIEGIIQFFNFCHQINILSLKGLSYPLHKTQQKKKTIA
jgi:hypothetical protein